MSERMDEVAELADAEFSDETGANETTGLDGTADVDRPTDETPSGVTELSNDEGRGWLPTFSGSVFSPRRFLVTLALTVGGLVVGGAVPLVGVVTQYVGLFVATFGYGLVSADSAYVEVSTAGAVAAAVTLLLGTLSTSGLVLSADPVGRYDVALTGVSVGVGLLVAVVGHYFGRDLRSGLTRAV